MSKSPGQQRGFASVYPWEEYVNSPEDHCSETGMTLREYYAGLAMQGLLAGLPPTADYNAEVIVTQAVKHADLLLEQLAEQGGQ